VVIDDIRGVDARLGFLLDVAVSRALIVAELALGGLLAERLRQLDAEVVELHNATHDTIEQPTDRSIAPIDPQGDGQGDRFADRETLQFLRPERSEPASGESPEVTAAIGKVFTLARARVSPRARLLGEVLIALENAAADRAGNFAAAVLSARELYGARTVDNAGVMPLFDGLDQARILVASSVQQLRAPAAVRVQVLRTLSTAHQRLVGATTGLVLEAVHPFTERLREVQAATGELRDAVARAERRRADLERKFATIVDENLPWGARGTTEW